MQETISTKTESKPDAIFVRLKHWLGGKLREFLEIIMKIGFREDVTLKEICKNPFALGWMIFAIGLFIWAFAT